VRRSAFWFCVFLFSTLVPSGLLGQTPDAASKAAPAGQQKSAGTKTGASLLHPETLKSKAPEVFEAKFVTTKGDFTIQVTRAWAPLGADRFYNLVKYHFFDGVAFYRVHTDFVVQFGMSPDPKITAAWDTATIKDDPVKQSNKPGYITFATSGANSRTTQLFINLGNNAQLDSMGFAAFGLVTEGMDIVKQLYSGYGEIPDMGGRGPSPGLIASQGKAYLEKNFPKLDSIKTARIVPAAGTPGSPAAKEAAPAAKKAASDAGEKPKP